MDAAIVAATAAAVDVVALPPPEGPEGTNTTLRL